MSIGKMQMLDGLVTTHWIVSIIFFFTKMYKLIQPNAVNVLWIIYLKQTGCFWKNHENALKPVSHNQHSFELIYLIGDP